MLLRTLGLTDERLHAASVDLLDAVHSAHAVQVTDTDQKCEKRIMEFISDRYPDHKFIGEEGSAAAGSTAELTDAPTWIVDPLDGTTNFVHMFPFVCVCIGLAINKQARPSDRLRVPLREASRGSSRCIVVS